VDSNGTLSYKITEILTQGNSQFCKKIMQLPNCATNGFAEAELGRESR
jgi:hypothetical protein